MRLIDADKLIQEIKMDIEDVGLQEKMVFYRINEAPQAEPSDGDLISRQDAIDAVENNSYGMGSRASVKAIKSLPSAETDMSEYADRLWKIAYERGKDETVQGEWIQKDMCADRFCSCCDYAVWDSEAEEYNYCPSCGTRMYKGGEDV